MIDRAAEAGTADTLTVDEAAHEIARCLARIIARRHHREARLRPSAFAEASADKGSGGLAGQPRSSDP